MLTLSLVHTFTVSHSARFITDTHAHTQTHTLSPSHTHIQTQTRSLTDTHTLIHTQAYTHTRTQAHMHARTHTHTHTLAQTHLNKALYSIPTLPHILDLMALYSIGSVATSILFY